MPACDILVELDRRGMVAGQEDMIEDTALTTSVFGFMADDYAVPEIAFVTKTELRGPSYL